MIDVLDAVNNDNRLSARDAADTPTAMQDAEMKNSSTEGKDKYAGRGTRRRRLVYECSLSV